MKFNEITWYSRLIAILLFVGVIPAISFYIGSVYQGAIDSFSISNKVVTTSNTPLAQWPDLNYKTLLSGDEYVITCGSLGLKGILKSDDTTTLTVYGDSSPIRMNGFWSSKGNHLMVTDAKGNVIDGLSIYLDPVTVLGKQLFIDDELLKNQGCGYVFGDSLSSIGLYTDVSFYQESR